MMLMKGALVGLLFFLLGALAYVLLLPMISSAFRNSAFDLRGGALVLLTLRNPYFWLALIGCVMIGCAMVGMWPTRKL